MFRVAVCVVWVRLRVCGGVWEGLGIRDIDCFCESRVCGLYLLVWYSFKSFFVEKLNDPVIVKLQEVLERDL